MDSKQASNTDHYPPPPPGPPPSQAAAPHHPNETPIQDYNVPPYNPAHPQFAPPSQSEEGLYDEVPIALNATQQKPGDATHEHAPARPGWSQRLSGMGAKAAAPLNKLAQKMGSETFLPTTMDKECEKAARILRSFCKDGIYSDASNPAAPTEGESKSDKAKPKSRTLLAIPSKVISRAVALAIFTTGRVGFHVSGATGSGILIARLPDGSWSPPSGIQVHSLGGGFVIGVDIYDCVVVINSHEALEAFTRTRVSLGSDMAVVAGPWGAGGAVDFAAPQGGKGKSASATADTSSQPQLPVAAAPGEPTPPPLPERKPSPLRQAISKPVYSYVKSRGFYAGVQVDGTVFTERKDANASFYGASLPVSQILRAEVPAGNWSVHTKALYDIVKGAEGWRGQTSAPGQMTTAPPVVSQAHLGERSQQGPVSPAQAFKAAEAESERETQRPVSMGPPQYTEQAAAGEEHPPAYVADGQAPPPPAPDSKTG